MATECEPCGWPGQGGFRATALPEMSDISYHISLDKHKNQCHLSLHAGKHVAVTAGGKLRLEGEKNVVFSLCCWDGVLKKKEKKRKNTPDAQERDLVFNMLKL